MYIRTLAQQDFLRLLRTSSRSLKLRTSKQNPKLSVETWRIDCIEASSSKIESSHSPNINPHHSHLGHVYIVSSKSKGTSENEDSALHSFAWYARKTMWTLTENVGKSRTGRNKILGPGV